MSIFYIDIDIFILIFIYIYNYIFTISKHVWNHHPCCMLIPELGPAASAPGPLVLIGHLRHLTRPTCQRSIFRRGISYKNECWYEYIYIWIKKYMNININIYIYIHIKKYIRCQIFLIYSYININERNERSGQIPVKTWSSSSSLYKKWWHPSC